MPVQQPAASEPQTSDRDPVSVSCLSLENRLFVLCDVCEEVSDVSDSEVCLCVEQELTCSQLAWRANC